MSIDDPTAGAELDDAAELLSTRDVFAKGGRLLARSLRALPVEHSIAITGAVVFSIAAVALSRVIGWVTDDIIVPGLD